MYIPDYFNEADNNKAISFIRTNSFGQLTSQVGGKLIASHLPFMIDKEGSKLLCHVARENPQWQNIEEQDVLVTFQGAHDYISPSWYTSPGVPTWNYQAVHVYGICKAINSPDKLKEIVEELTLSYEANYEKPWSPKYSETMLKYIVGIELTIREIQCKFKLNQNRSETDRAGVISALEDQGSETLANVMRENERSKYSK
jgi:transcriptional regulator